MDIILKHFNICSIGYDCSIKRFISQYIDCELNVFDYIGTPMWSINELILNNFNDITNINYRGSDINKEINLLRTQLRDALCNTILCECDC